MPKETIVALIVSLSILVACTAAPPVEDASTQPQPIGQGPDRAPLGVDPTLDDLWSGRARFVLEAAETGLPMGESDTLLLGDGRLVSYVHASAASAGVVDQCGDPVVFPGCVVLFESHDKGLSFAPVEDPPRCLIPCRQCPCDSRIDQIDQQQYPQVTQVGDRNWVMVYEYRANTFLRRSEDGIAWSLPQEMPLTGIWADWLMGCRDEERIGAHPYAGAEYDCLVGSPPGVMVASNGLGEDELIVFVGLGQNPGAMGCYRGSASGPATLLRKCRNNPLFRGAQTYGPLDRTDGAANPYFDFRTISSASALEVGKRTYLFYEGVRGPGPGAAGDTQFGLGLARSSGDRVDGPWEVYPGNPILVDLPGNVGLGHADVLVVDGRTVLYTSLDGETRSRLLLQWIEP